MRCRGGGALTRGASTLFHASSALPQLTPFSNAKSIADAGCGGVANQDTGVRQPLPENVFIAGTDIQVQWKLTIPHPADVEDTGVRIALHYESGSSFECNILKGGLEGDPGFDGPNRRVAAGLETDTTPGQTRSVTVRLPEGQTCDYCVLQWVWAARSDGGFYMNCADISIVDRDANGNPLAPNYQIAENPSSELPRNQPAKNYPCVFLDGSSPSSAGATAGIVILVLILLVGAGAAYFLGGKMGGGGAGRPPPSTPSRRRRHPAAAAAAASSGWSKSTDASGRTYYVSSANGQTQWDRGGHGGKPPALGGAAGRAARRLAGGVAGRAYYYNSVAARRGRRRPHSASRVPRGLAGGLHAMLVGCAVMMTRRESVCVWKQPGTGEIRVFASAWGSGNVGHARARHRCVLGGEHPNTARRAQCRLVWAVLCVSRLVCVEHPVRSAYIASRVVGAEARRMFAKEQMLFADRC